MSNPIDCMCPVSCDLSPGHNLSQAQLQRLHIALAKLIRTCQVAAYEKCTLKKISKLTSLCAFLKFMVELPHFTDYTPLTPQLKKRLLRAQNRIDGPTNALYHELPAIYLNAIQSYNAAVNPIFFALNNIAVPIETKLNPVPELRRQYIKRKSKFY